MAGRAGGAGEKKWQTLANGKENGKPGEPRWQMANLGKWQRKELKNNARWQMATRKFNSPDPDGRWSLWQRLLGVQYAHEGRASCWPRAPRGSRPRPQAPEQPAKRAARESGAPCRASWDPYLIFYCLIYNKIHIGVGFLCNWVPFILG